MPWEFWVDRGGTFTDVIGRAPDGTLHTAKLLSSDRAPVEGIRSILERKGEVGADDPLPRCEVKLGTTVATNALLERRGARTLLVTNRGLGDVFVIRTQERPELFALAIRKPPPLHEDVLEVAGRTGVDGEPVEPLDEAAAREALAAARRAGVESIAIAMLHAYAHPELEVRLAKLARSLGFPFVGASHELAREMGFLARGETSVADAYLTPLLQRYVAETEAALPGSRVRFMQSSGGLTEGARFRGPGALLSGPAGGVVGAARVARAAGFERAIGFDMGGTSTDVSLIVNGEVERAFETEVGGIKLRAPMLRIHTVAAGGGSLCRFDGFRLTVGPESGGADPGPLCYGLRDEAGRLRARELALTDANLLLGRLQPDRFPFALEPGPVREALARLADAVRAAGHARSDEEVAAGFVDVANANMARAIQEVSVARGVDPRDCLLVGFGGAGGQHVCAVARALGMGRIRLHPLAGLLSAYGIGTADVSWDGQRDAGRVALEADGHAPPGVEEILMPLQRAGREALAAEGVRSERVRVQRALDLRYAGTETALDVPEPADRDWAAAFAREHETRFGYMRPGRTIEVTTARVRVVASAAPAAAAPPAAPTASGAPTPRRRVSAWFPGGGRTQAPVFDREALRPGHVLEGPAIVLEDTGTVVVDPGFVLRVEADGVLDLEDRAGPPRPDPGDLSEPDPVRLEVFGARFMSIAEQMGAVLRNTAVSTNIKERLDYSCAVFDRDGGLVANAPHIPVHLGAMGETVRAVRDAFPDLGPDDVVATNDPFAGGSHLPDVTVVTPVFVEAAPKGRGQAAAAQRAPGERSSVQGRGQAAAAQRAPGERSSRGPAFFVASRGHHADIGGRTPGSMPADSRTLEDEGVLLRAFRLVADGRLDEERLRAALTGARHPARNPDDNVADMEAMVAANRAGVRLLHAMVREQGLAAVDVTMRQLQEAAAGKVAREIDRLPDGEHAFEDRMDDGTPIRVRLVVRGERMTIDFTGTGSAVPGNLNAPRAVVRAAVIYVLRSLVAERIPLNGGCLAPVELVIPPGSLLDPPEGSAVVGGNVETSQRVVDALLGALGVAAASQGTMNNVAFGTERFGYYETIGGGSGAGEGFAGASGVHVHMTNTRITDAEVLESRYPVRLVSFALRRGSGGAGRWPGGDGLVRRWTFLAPVEVSLLTERRVHAPFGLRGGAPGARGRNAIERRDGRVEELPGRAHVALGAGDGLVVETPGGGGFGAPA